MSLSFEWVFDAAVLALEAVEADCARRRDRLMARANSLGDRMPQAVPLVHRLAALLIGGTALCADSCRICRWALIARQAARGEPADGPILSTPEDVERYFQTLSAGQ